VAIFVDGAFWKFVRATAGIEDLVEFAGGLDGVLHDAKFNSWSTPVYWTSGDPFAWKTSREEMLSAGITGVEALKCKAAVRKEVRDLANRRS